MFTASHDPLPEPTHFRNPRETRDPTTVPPSQRFAAEVFVGLLLPRGGGVESSLVVKKVSPERHHCFDHFGWGFEVFT